MLVAQELSSVQAYLHKNLQMVEVPVVEHYWKDLQHKMENVLTICSWPLPQAFVDVQLLVAAKVHVVMVGHNYD